MSDLAAGVFQYDWSEEELQKLKEKAVRITGKSAVDFYKNGPVLPNWTLGYQLGLDMVKIAYGTLVPDAPVTLENFDLDSYIAKCKPFRESVANISGSGGNFRKHDWPIRPSELLQGVEVPLFSELVASDESLDTPRTLIAEITASDSLAELEASKNSNDVFDFKPMSDNEVVMVHYHGGAYLRGSPSIYRNFFVKLSKKTNSRVIAPSYRLAPDTVYPAQIYDGFMFYLYLLKQGFNHKNIVLMGDSAGGNLVLCILQLLKQVGMDQPKGAILYSPWVDLSHTNEFNVANAAYDFVSLPNINSVLNSTRLYIMPGKPLTDEFRNRLLDPLISPTFGNYDDIAPLYIQSGESEVLLDDIDRFAVKVGAEKTTIKGRDHPGFSTDNKNIYEMYVGMVHIFFFFNEADETFSAIDGVANFLNRLG
ncbi:Esterase [Smittium culicis]|uniref:Esterase n=1 Tax=Smittium culicis TaxID=133412 RepID=A0A1R1XM58_9FUNG|nr:Esterase [Smittium culicis]OMJ15693.1 Esterase [Smittium culicis]